MKLERQITVDIFVDSETPDIAVEAVQQGVESLNEIAPWFRVRDQVEEVSVTYGGSEHVCADKFNISLTADIGILVTGRYLALEDNLRGSTFIGPKDKEGLMTVGYASLPKVLGIARFALVGAGSRYESSPAITARHEIAHLLGLKREGKSFDRSDHCSTPDCTLAAVDGTVEEFTEVEVIAKHALSSKPRIRKERRLVSREPNQNHFCDECTDQFFTNADIFRRMLAGYDVSKRDKRRIFGK